MSRILPALSPETFEMFIDGPGREISVKMHYVKDPRVELEFVRAFFTYFDVRPLEAR